MTRDEVIKMACDAGLGFFKTREEKLTTADVLMRFATLVAEKEREECAKVCDSVANNSFSASGVVWGEDIGRRIRARANK